jgi:hypothetical protein
VERGEGVLPTTHTKEETNQKKAYQVVILHNGCFTGQDRRDVARGDMWQHRVRLEQRWTGWVRINEYEGQEWKTKGKDKSRGLKR